LPTVSGSVSRPAGRAEPRGARTTPILGLTRRPGLACPIYGFGLWCECSTAPVSAETKLIMVQLPSAVGSAFCTRFPRRWPDKARPYQWSRRQGVFGSVSTIRQRSLCPTYCRKLCQAKRLGQRPPRRIGRFGALRGDRRSTRRVPDVRQGGPRLELGRAVPRDCPLDRRHRRLHDARLRPTSLDPQQEWDETGLRCSVTNGFPSHPQEGDAPRSGLAT